MTGADQSGRTIAVVETTITYCRKFNLGNYENEDLAVQFTVPAGGDINAAFAQARAIVEEQQAAFQMARRAEQRRRRGESDEIDPPF